MHMPLKLAFIIEFKGKFNRINFELKSFFILLVRAISDLQGFNVAVLDMNEFIGFVGDLRFQIQIVAFDLLFAN